jgi:uncharacterized protein (DUF2147 family)
MISRFNLWRTALFGALCLCGALARADNPSIRTNDPPAHLVLGNWLTQDRDGIIAISLAADGTYQGRIVGGGDPDRLDTTNTDPVLRREPLQGHVIMQGMHYLGEGRWSTGTIRDPDNGHVYKCRLELLSPERLQVRGFLGISLFGRSQVWTRYTSKRMHLRPGH